MKTKDRGARKRAKLSKMHNAATKKISRTTITGPTYRTTPTKAVYAI